MARVEPLVLWELLVLEERMLLPELESVKRQEFWIVVKSLVNIQWRLNVVRPSSIYLETKVFMGFMIIRSFADVMVPFSAIRSAAKKRDQTDEKQGGCSGMQVCSIFS